MSEAKTEEKKKGKMPVIIAVVAVLFGGGFFMMKGKGEKKEPEVKLGKIVEMEEKLVNLTDQVTFLRTTIALHLKEGFKEEQMKDLMPAVDDAVVTTLKGLGPNEVRSVANLATLKRTLASKVNKVLDQVAGHEGDDSKDKDKKKKKSHDEESKPTSAEDAEHPDWDSDTGPVLKVYFKAFAIQ